MTKINEEKYGTFYSLEDTLKDLRKDIAHYGTIGFAAICSIDEEDGSQEILGYMHTEDMNEVELLDDDFYQVMTGEALLALLEQQMTHQ